MADAVTLPGDLYVINAVSEVFRAAFTNSLELVDGCMGTDPSNPIVIKNLNLFNEGGQYVDAPVIAQTSGLVTAQDYTSIAAVDTLKSTSRNDRGVLMKAKIGPWAYAPDAIKISRMTESDLLGQFAWQAALDVRKYIQDAVIFAMKAALDNMTSTLHTNSVWNAATRTNLDAQQLAATRAKLGEFSQQLNCWLFRSECFYTDLVQNQLGAGVSGIADKTVNSGLPATLGMKYCVVDHSALTTADGGFDKYYAIGMGPGCVEVDLQPPTFYPTFTYVDTATVQKIVRADLGFTIRLPGFQWDSQNGGANPANTSGGVGLSTNWDVTYANHKEVKLVLWEGNYSGN